jgi:hypothetical protein
MLAVSSAASNWASVVSLMLPGTLPWLPIASSPLSSSSWRSSCGVIWRPSTLTCCV